MPSLAKKIFQAAKKVASVGTKSSTSGKVGGPLMLRPDFKASAQKLPEKGKLTGASYILPRGTRSAESFSIPGNYRIIEQDGVEYLVRKDLVNPSSLRKKET